jgi:hypothetical protein
MAEDKSAQQAVENVEKPAKAQDHPAAGPHAKDDLTDKAKTPGTGALPDEGVKEADVGPD